jgi:hypothetical protein
MPEDRSLPPAAEAFLQDHILSVRWWEVRAALIALLDEVRAEERERCAAYLENCAAPAIRGEPERYPALLVDEYAATRVELYAEKIRQGETE